MKALIQLITLSLFLVSCTSERGIWEKEVISLIDGTDSTIMIPVFAQFKPFLDLENNNNGMSFRTKIITDIDFGSFFEKTLNPKGDEDETAEERFYRKKNFMKDVEFGYNQIAQQAIQKQHSIVYRVIATELNRLTQSGAKEKIMLISSDLMENSDFLNFYNEPDRDSLLKFPDRVKVKFSEQIKLTPLSGVTVYFTFRPENFEQNETYRVILEIYRQMITEAGGKCCVGLSLQ